MAYLKLAAALMFAAGLMIYPAECGDAARRAMELWVGSVAPALFPFAAVMPFLTCPEARHAYDRLLGLVVKKLFGLPGGTASAMMVGFVSGSPGGALAVARVAGEEGLTEGQAARLAGIACGVSPVYVLSVIGVGIYGSKTVGWRLVIAQFVSQVVVGIVFRKLRAGKNIVKCIEIPENRAITGAVCAALRVCGYMVMFSVGLKLAEKAFGENIWRIAAFVDLPTGVYKCGSDLLTAAALGFGGMCIGTQNLAVLKDMVKPWVYYTQKAVGGLVCAEVYWGLKCAGVTAILTGYVAEAQEFEVNLLILVIMMAPAVMIFLPVKAKKQLS